MNNRDNYAWDVGEYQVRDVGEYQVQLENHQEQTNTSGARRHDSDACLVCSVELSLVLEQ